MFSEKLNFMMNLTHSTNETVAEAVDLDPSYVSLLRSGTRNLPKRQKYVMDIARLMVRRINNDFKKTLMSGILGLNEYPSDPEEAAQRINAWMVDAQSVKYTKVETELFLKSLSAVKTRPFAIKDIKEEINFQCENGDEYYYGVEGKKKAVERFMLSVLQEPTPQTLLLFSEEDMGWLTDDNYFTKQWSEILSAIFAKGNRVKIIHTVSRDTEDIMFAIPKWLPLYMTGMIEPYYYPEVRDGLFQRTLFLAPKTGAIVSTSVSRDCSDMMNLYTTDSKALKSFETEFDRYLSLCQPLMHVFNQNNCASFLDYSLDFLSENVPTVMLSQTPSLMTLPDNVLQDVFKRCKCETFKALCLRAKKHFEENPQIPVTEIIEMIDLKTVNNIPIPMSDMFGGEKMYYTKDEYIFHLYNVLKHMMVNENYNVILIKKHNNKIRIWGKESLGVFIARTDIPSMVFTIKEQNLTSALWTYLSEQCGPGNKRNHKFVIKAYKDYLRAQKQALNYKRRQLPKKYKPDAELPTKN